MSNRIYIPESTLIAIATDDKAFGYIVKKDDIEILKNGWELVHCELVDQCMRNVEYTYKIIIKPVEGDESSYYGTTHTFYGDPIQHMDDGMYWENVDQGINRPVALYPVETKKVISYEPKDDGLSDDINNDVLSHWNDSDLESCIHVTSEDVESILEGTHSLFYLNMEDEKTVVISPHGSDVRYGCIFNRDRSESGHIWTFRPPKMVETF